MAALNRQQQQDINRNFSSVIDFLDRRLSKTSVHLVETPCYFYKGKKSKLEVTVFSNPRIGTIDVRIIKLKNFDREPSFEDSYQLDRLSIGMFERTINDLIAQVDQK